MPGRGARGRGPAGLGPGAAGFGPAGRPAGRPAEGFGAGVAAGPPPMPAPASALVSGAAGASDAGAFAAGATGSAGAAGVAGAACAAGAVGAAGAAGACTAGLAAGLGRGAGLAPAAGPPAGFFAGAWVANASRRRFATGGSTVDDADRTNSPMSFNFLRATLLSTPSSFASSYTRTLATALLLGPGHGARTVSRCSCSFQGAHRALSSITSRLLRFVRLQRCRLRGSPPEMLADLCQVHRPREPEGPTERTPTFSTIEAPHVRMQVRTPTREPAPQVETESRWLPLAHHHTDQVGTGRSAPTADTCPDRDVRRRPGRPVFRHAVYPAAGPDGSGCVSAGPVDEGSPCGSSGRMSMRQPVSRAASRAFWPSLPMARDS